MSQRVLGTIRASDVLERRALELLDTYLPLYLDEVVRQRTPVGRSIVAPERPTLLARTASDRIADADLPALVVGCSGTSGPPVQRVGAADYAASWTLHVISVTAGSEPDEGRALASVTAAAASAVLVQTLPDPVAGVHAVRWTGEEVADLEVALDESTRQLRHVCRRTLELDVPAALSLGGSPPPVPEDPPQDPGERQTVETTHLTVTPVEEIEQ